MFSTRDECNKLVEMIQSRVPEANSVEIGKETENEVPIMITDQGQSLNHNRNLYQISNFSPRLLPSLSPSFYAKEAVIPDLRDKAVLEAKRWFEEKKLTPSPIYDRSYGPRNLTTRMNQYVSSFLILYLVDALQYLPLMVYGYRFKVFFTIIIAACF